MQKVTLTTSRAINFECPEGGWGYVVRDDSHSGEGSGRTKNGLRLHWKCFVERLELIAVIKGLERLKVPCEVLLRSESKCPLECVSSERFVWRKQGWPKGDYLADLGQRLDEAAKRHIIDTQQIWGGSGDPDLKRCDALAWSQASWFPESGWYSISPNIPTDLPSLAYLQALSLHDLALFLLKLLALLFPRSKTFDRDYLYSPGNLCRSDGRVLTCDPDSEVMVRIRYLLNTPWEEMVRNGYITELPLRRERFGQWFEITAKGRELAESMTIDSLTLEAEDD